MRRKYEPILLRKRQSPLEEFFADLSAVLGLGPHPALRRKGMDTRLTEPTRGRLPSRGLLYSFLAHEIAIFALLVLPQRFAPERHFYEVTRWVSLDSKLIYTPLPELGGGHKGGGRPGGKRHASLPKQESASPAPAPKAGGLVYPAPQPIVSNPPNPTNRIQTILQPEVIKPPELKAPVPLPNIVKLARGTKLPAPPPLVPKVNLESLPPARPPEAPKLRAALRPPNMPYSLPLETAPPPIENPKLTLPTAPPKPPEQVPYQPIVPKVQQPTTESNSGPTAAPNLAIPSGAGGSDERSLLVLSPMPGPPEAAANVPTGEARGQFAMGPEPNLTGSSKLPPGSPSGVEGGTGTGGADSLGLGGTGTGAGGTGIGSGEVGEGVGSGTGTGTGSGAGINGTGGGGTGSGTGTGSASGPGRGEGTGTGTGTGSGPGPGTNPFTGISIAGGSGTTSVVGGPKAPPSRSTYGMTVVATASSGGGLRDYGIFRNESVFTVYIEMTHSPTPAPSWTLQYALLKRQNPGSVSASAGSGPLHMQDHVVSPYPINKEKPQFPTEVVARNEGRVIVVYAEITSEGKTEHARIIQSPNPLLNQPLLEALAKWTFRPAEKDGQPVPVKALVGVPLSLPPH